MKKILIIAVALVATGLTAVSLTHKESKTEAKVQIIKADFVRSPNAPKSDLGSAD
ncbi:hypothetical protein LX99_02988 [Mucilaginibacter oryzae]|uniref:Uncharacterized protein n=1 Tax=Mucilaginibacter oryzae TaxID=468058 RepID=A0A316H9Q8_9SPHI|nr:hypothetical protein [Mucilaginibacter oryzae]PWK77178.1 hypothetical protein LX99_02988 [Mucilaginibacter oryzae]